MRPVPGSATEASEADAITGELVATLDEIVVRELPHGGWTFAHPGRARPEPLTVPLRIAERVGSPLGLATWDIVVMRSPGTPAAGLVLLDGYRLTGREGYLASARRAGDLVVAAQLPSGGWFSEMPVEDGRLARWFRATVRRTTLDDDVTTGAVRMLLELWRTTGEVRYRESAIRGVELLVRAQLPSGAWPLMWRPSWKRVVWATFEDLPTLNDGATTQAIETLLMAGTMLGRADLVAAARRGGDWLVRVRRPPPQAGWSQQYDVDGHPVRARRFEGIALAAWESRLAIDTLIDLAAATGDDRYCAPVREAAQWLARSAIAPRCWARFYALPTNEPLYFDDSGARITSAAHAHQPYDWTGDFGIDALLDRIGVEGYATAEGRPRARARRLLGDPGSCRPAVDRTFDPRSVGDHRLLIAHAGFLSSALHDTPTPTACRSDDQARSMKSAAATKQPRAAR